MSKRNSWRRLRWGGRDTPRPRTPWPSLHFCEQTVQYETDAGARTSRARRRGWARTRRASSRSSRRARRATGSRRCGASRRRSRGTCARAPPPHTRPARPRRAPLTAASTPTSLAQDTCSPPFAPLPSLTHDRQPRRGGHHWTAARALAPPTWQLARPCCCNAMVTDRSRSGGRSSKLNLTCAWQFSWEQQSPVESGSH